MRTQVVRKPPARAGPSLRQIIMKCADAHAGRKETSRQGGPLLATNYNEVR